MHEMTTSFKNSNSQQTWAYKCAFDTLNITFCEGIGNFITAIVTYTIG
jgi:hypothetical protein